MSQLFDAIRVAQAAGLTALFDGDGTVTLVKGEWSPEPPARQGEWYKISHATPSLAIGPGTTEDQVAAFINEAMRKWTNR